MDPRVRKTPWRRKWQPAPVFLPESHGQRSLAGSSPWGCKESDTPEWLTLSRHEHKPRPSSLHCALRQKLCCSQTAGQWRPRVSQISWCLFPSSVGSFCVSVPHFGSFPSVSSIFIPVRCFMVTCDLWCHSCHYPRSHELHPQKTVNSADKRVCSDSSTSLPHLSPSHPASLYPETDSGQLRAYHDL